MNSRPSRKYWTYLISWKSSEAYGVLAVKLNRASIAYATIEYLARSIERSQQVDKVIITNIQKLSAYRTRRIV